MAEIFRECNEVSSEFNNMFKEVFHSTWIVIMHHSSRGSVLCRSLYRPAFVIISFV